MNVHITPRNIYITRHGKLRQRQCYFADYDKI
jgi:hypothetical protein